MNAHLHLQTVLVLNRQWVPVDRITPADAFSHLYAGTARALLIRDTIEPVDWTVWRNLSVQKSAATSIIGTSSGPVAIPTVILLQEFNQVPLHIPRFGLKELWRRDKGRCQYTGKFLQPGEGDIDHVIPRSRGGQSSWENCVLSDRAVNRRKGAKTPTEAGLRLLRSPVAPQPVPVSAIIHNSFQIPEWDLFLQPQSAGSIPA